MCCLSYELARYRDSAERLPPIGAEICTGQGLVVVTRTEAYQEAVWVRDDEGGEHRIAYADLPPGPYHQCGDCNCGKKPKRDAAHDAHDVHDESPPDAWADPPGGAPAE